MTSALTPPRTPGPVVVRAERPVNRLASASTVFGAIGLVLPATGIVAVVLGLLGLRGIKRAGDVQRGRGLAITGIVLGGISMLIALGIVGIAFSSYWMVRQTTPMIQATAINRVHAAMSTHMRQTGQYPAHVAEMVIDPNASIPAAIFSPEPFADRPPARTVMVGDYDFADYAGAPEDDAAVKAAFAQLDLTTLTYHFGQWRFARLPRSTLDRKIVFAWYRDPGVKNVTVIADDGSTRIVVFERWGELWEADAAARVEHGLPALPSPPPFP